MSATETLKEAAERAAEAAAEFARLAAELAASGAAEGAGAASGIDPFMFRLAIFALACFVGYYVVWSVTPALHTPLMSGAKAISGRPILGAMTMAAMVPADEPIGIALATASVVFATINVIGGFMVTDRMLQMFGSRKKGK